MMAELLVGKVQILVIRTESKTDPLVQINKKLLIPEGKLYPCSIDYD